MALIYKTAMKDAERIRLVKAIDDLQQQLAEANAEIERLKTRIKEMEDIVRAFDGVFIASNEFIDLAALRGYRKKLEQQSDE